MAKSSPNPKPKATAPNPPSRASSPRSEASGAAPRKEAWIGASGLLLFAGLHLWLRVDPTLRYDLLAPAFFTDQSFFARFASVPGGPLDYAAAGFAQFGFHGWLGATAFTAVLAGAFFAARHLFTNLSGRGSTGAAGGLVVLLAMLPGQFDGNAEGTALGLLLVLVVAIGWLALPTRPRAVRVVTFWALTALLFYAAGTVPALWLVGVGMIVALLRRDLRLALECGAVLLLLPVWIWLRPGWDPWAIVGQWGHGMTRALTLAAWVFVPLWLGVQELIALGSSKVPWLARIRAHHESMTPRRRHAVGLMGWILGAGLIGFSLDGSRRAVAQVEHSVQRQDWKGALVAARDLEEWPSSTRLHVTRARAHSGRLLEDLFASPQDRTLSLLPTPASGLEMARALAQTLLELGQVNLAERLAHESLELEGARPRTLQLLARINVLLDRPEAARVFLHRLRLAPFRGAEAEAALRVLAADPSGAGDRDLVALRGRRPQTDLPESNLPTDMLLRQLLTANRTNRMAFEYLLAFHLLNGQPNELVAELDRWEGFSAGPLPKACAEAVLLTAPRTDAAASAKARPVSPATVERHRRFQQLLQQQARDPAPARAALAGEFGDSYWYYHVFGRSAPTAARRGPTER
ncbi:MAG: DUF6057 family protein [Limisphaerales bacterium]